MTSLTFQELRDKSVNIAADIKWDGYELMKIMLEALTECNYHKEREIIETALSDKGIHFNFPTE